MRRTKNISVVVVMLSIWLSPVSAVSENLQLSESVWHSLTPIERETLAQKYVIETIPANQVGIITDIQVVNESTPGTSGGATLGSEIASSSYIDHAFDGDNWDYSAKDHLRAEVVGGLIGSLFDEAATQRFHFRYTVTTLDGAMQYLDEIKSDPFRRSPGECVAVPSFQSIKQDICKIDANLIRTNYILASTTGRRTPKSKTLTTAQAPVDVLNEHHVSSQSAILCKFGTSAPVSISQAECLVAEGVVLP